MVFDVHDSERLEQRDFPRHVKELKHVWIPMSDGTRLAARIWLPDDAEQNPVPAILEYIPYRKNDFTALRDSLRHPYFAGHGYASIRVDMRGSGDSDGILYDEYLPQEQQDALDVLDWIAGQPWSTGSVGMIGKSWGGFNGLQVAACQHPALKTIITICSTDDRYADDVHYRGGAVMASDMLWWASTMLAYNGRPPDPEVVGDDWLSAWLERLEETPPFVEAWLEHQRRDAFWKHGSVCEDYTKVDIPVFAVGGWADAYTDAIFRMMEHLPGPRKALIGPWAHEFPEVAAPGPAVGFLQECLRWWDCWLKGHDTGIMDEPMMRVWMQEGVPPQTFYDERPGRWVAETAWPTQSTTDASLWLENGHLAAQEPQSATAITVAGAQQHGLYSGVFCPFGQPGDLAADQRVEDGLSTTFTSDPLRHSVEILGFPKLTVDIASDKPNAVLAVRLCDVAPDGTSTLVSWGMLNLTHRDSHEHPSPLISGETYTVTVQLNSTAYVLPAGHRWRVALSSTYWPHAWPSPEPVRLTVTSGSTTRLALPVRSAQAGDNADDALPPLQPPETAPVLAKETLRDEHRTRDVQHDTVSGVWRLIDVSDGGARRLLPDGVEFGTVNHNTYTIREGDPLSAHVECTWDVTVGRGDWQTRLATVSTMTADTTQFHVMNAVTAFHGEHQVFSKTWTKSIPREWV